MTELDRLAIGAGIDPWDAQRKQEKQASQVIQDDSFFGTVA